MQNALNSSFVSAKFYRSQFLAFSKNDITANILADDF
jgi:hypothetical protein